MVAVESQQPLEGLLEVLVEDGVDEGERERETGR